MLITVKGVYENGRIYLSEELPVNFNRSEVIITFLPEDENKAGTQTVKGKVIIPVEVSKSPGI